MLILEIGVGLNYVRYFQKWIVYISKKLQVKNYLGFIFSTNMSTDSGFLKA